MTDVTVEALRAKLDELRAMIAGSAITTPPDADSDDADDTAVIDPDALAVGDVIHVLAPIIVAGAHRVRGEEFTVTKAMLDVVDRNGVNSLTRTLDPAYQIERWGHPVLGRGEFPLDRFEPWSARGDETWTALYISERDRARSIYDIEDRADAEAAVTARFGAPPHDWREPYKPARSKWSY